MHRPHPLRWLIAKIDAAADRRINSIFADHEREEAERKAALRYYQHTPPSDQPPGTYTPRSDQP